MPVALARLTFTVDTTEVRDDVASVTSGLRLTLAERSTLVPVVASGARVSVEVSVRPAEDRRGLRDDVAVVTSGLNMRRAEGSAAVLELPSRASVSVALEVLDGLVGEATETAGLGPEPGAGVAG